MLDVPDVVEYGKVGSIDHRLFSRVPQARSLVDTMTNSSFQLFFADACLFPVAILAMKCSILWFYHRIFPIRKFTISCIVIGAVTFAWLIASLVAQFLICRPFQYFWDKSIPGGKCISANQVAYFISSPPDILTSLAILVLPIPWLWGLQMQRRRKIAISGIFILGSLYVCFRFFSLFLFLPKLLRLS